MPACTYAGGGAGNLVCVAGPASDALRTPKGGSARVGGGVRICRQAATSTTLEALPRQPASLPRLGSWAPMVRCRRRSASPFPPSLQARRSSWGRLGYGGPVSSFRAASSCSRSRSPPPRTYQRGRRRWRRHAASAAAEALQLLQLFGQQAAGQQAGAGMAATQHQPHAGLLQPFHRVVKGIILSGACRHRAW